MGGIRRGREGVKQNQERESGVCEATCENLNHIPGSIENILTVMETKRASHVVGQFSTEGIAADTVRVNTLIGGVNTVQGCLLHSVTLVQATWFYKIT